MRWALLAGLLCVPCWAQDGVVGALGEGSRSGATIQDLDDVRGLVQGVIDRSYPELADAQIEVEEVDGGDTVFFTSIFKAFPANRSKRRYVVCVNRKVYALKPPRIAVEGILAHELTHTLDYAGRSAAKLLKLVTIFLSKRRMTRFERRTDLIAVQRGYGPGIKAYREWIYPQLTTEKALKRKRTRYLTPEEIDLAIATLASDPELYATWIADPPRALTVKPGPR